MKTQSVIATLREKYLEKEIEAFYIRDKNGKISNVSLFRKSVNYQPIQLTVNNVDVDISYDEVEFYLETILNGEIVYLYLTLY